MACIRQGRELKGRPARTPRAGSQVFGVKKVSAKKLGEFVGAVEHYAKESRRAELFAILGGLLRDEDYSRHISDAFFIVLRRCFIGDSATAKGGAETPKPVVEKPEMCKVRPMDWLIDGLTDRELTD